MSESASLETAKKRCPSCGALTIYGREQSALRAREHPIYDTDLSQPLSQLVEGLRDTLTEVRGQLNDIRRGFPAWERVQDVEGLLTCGIVTLYDTVQEMRKSEAKWGLDAKR
jgi:hypothetical protein